MYIRKKKIRLSIGVMMLIQTFLCWNTLVAKPVYSPEEDPIEYPYTIIAKYDFGFTNELRLVERSEKEGADGKYTYENGIDRYLRVHRFCLDIGWTQISKFWCKYFGGYPKIGFDLKYTDLQGKGYMGSLLLYFSPQFSYLSDFEFKPKIGVGIVYVNIPLVLQKKVPKPELADSGTYENGEAWQRYETVYVDEPYHEKHDEEYRRGIAMEFDFNFDFENRLSENWVLLYGLGFVYIPDFLQMSESAAADRDAEREKTRVDNLYQHRKWWLFNKDTDILMLTFGVGLGYIPAPNDREYDIDELPDSIVKITASYSRKKYDRIAEYNFDKLVEESSKHYVTDVKDIDVKRIDSVAANQERYESFNVFALQMQWALRICHSHAFVFGNEFIIDNSNAALRRSLGLPGSGAFKWAVSVGHDFMYGRFSFGQHLGFYVLNSVYSSRLSSIFREAAFVRFNIEYRVFDNWLIGAGMRSRVVLLYDDRDDPIESPKFKMSKFYSFSLRVDYPEIYIGYSF